MFNKRYKSHHDAENAYNDLLTRERSNISEVYEYLDNSIKAKNNAIYIHVPFCDKICSFCNMNRTLATDVKEEYVEQVLKQIENYGKCNAMKTAKIEAVFFGGGTPTTLSAEAFKKIVVKLRECFNLDEDVEITCETTLHNLSEEHLKVFNEIGVNRLSIGIQTFQDEGRKFFNRTYSKSEIVQKLKALKQNFNGYVCIDKIYNYPGETKEMVADDVKQIIDLELDSVSFYSLMVHEGSALAKKYDESQFSDERDLQFHDLFVEELLKTGDYELFELTKIVRKNRDKYKYMTIRNSNGNTIPIGRGAGGKIDYFHIYSMDFERVMVAKSVNDRDESAHNLYGLFQYSKIDKTNIEQLPYYKAEYLSNTIEQLIVNNYLEEKADYYQLTSKGLFYGNNIGGTLTRELLLGIRGEK